MDIKKKLWMLAVLAVASLALCAAAAHAEDPDDSVALTPLQTQALQDAGNSIFRRQESHLADYLPKTQQTYEDALTLQGIVKTVDKRSPKDEAIAARYDFVTYHIQSCQEKIRTNPIQDCSPKSDELKTLREGELLKKRLTPMWLKSFQDALEKKDVQKEIESREKGPIPEEDAKITELAGQINDVQAKIEDSSNPFRIVYLQLKKGYLESQNEDVQKELNENEEVVKILSDPKTVNEIAGKLEK